MITDFNKCVDMSLVIQESTNYECRIPITIQGEKFTAYSVDIAYRELSFNCPEGYVSFYVDSYGFRYHAVLNDIERVI